MKFTSLEIICKLLLTEVYKNPTNIYSLSGYTQKNFVLAVLCLLVKAPKWQTIYRKNKVLRGISINTSKHEINIHFSQRVFSYLTQKTLCLIYKVRSVTEIITVFETRIRLKYVLVAEFFLISQQGMKYTNTNEYTHTHTQTRFLQLKLAKYYFVQQSAILYIVQKNSPFRIHAKVLQAYFAQHCVYLRFLVQRDDNQCKFSGVWLHNKFATRVSFPYYILHITLTSLCYPVTEPHVPKYCLM